MISSSRLGDVQFSFKPLSGEEQVYLARVYALLCAALISLGAGTYFAIYVYRIPTILALLVEIGSIMYISNSIDDQKRTLVFVASSFIWGVCLRNIVAEILFINPAILTTAIILTMSIFASFSLSAMYCKRASMLYLSSILGSLSSVMLVVVMSMYIFPTKLSYNLVLYGGLFLEMGYVFYHTQKTLDDMRRGKKDYIRHSLDFFLTIVNIFRYIAIILADKERKKNNEK